MMSTSFACLQDLALRLLEALAHHLGVAADAGALLLVLDADEFGAIDFTWSPTSGGVVRPHDRAEPEAAPIAARPATPAPMTNTLAGGTLPAAVISGR